MSRANLLKLVLLFSLSMNLAVVAAFSYQQSREPGAAAAGDPFASLSLDAEQRGQYDRLKADFDSYRGNCHDQMTELRAQLVAELTADAPDQEAIAAALAAMRDRQSATEARLVDHLMAIRAILRPEQHHQYRRLLERTLGGGCKSNGRKCVHAIHEQ